MYLVIEQLRLKPDHLLIDGNRFKPFPAIPHTCIVKGDGKYLSIAAASILAKTYRDDFMDQIHYKFPDYNWLSNKGYPTLYHRKKVREIGISPYHRRSFSNQGSQLLLDF